MAGTIYKHYSGRPTDAWYQLTEDEQNRLVARIRDALEQVGGKQIIACDSSWSSERRQFFGVEEFPNIEAVQKHSALLNELNWLHYIESDTLLGTATGA